MKNHQVASNNQHRIGDAARRLSSALAFGGSIAAIVILLGTRDMESYEHAFVSLDRGTALETIRVFGHPVYTQGLGLGVRLPLHASLGASPVAALAPYLPAPLTYLLLMAFAIAAACMVVRHALEPLCGRLVSWLAMGLLFCSVPLVNYTIYDDWPETAVNYCAFVGCVFAPHALLALLAAPMSATARRLAALSVAGIVWALVGLSQPGYWPLLGGSVVFTSALALCRSDHPFRRRLMVVAALGSVAFVAVALQIPDITRELSVAGSTIGTMKRYVDAPRGGFISANLFPFGLVGARLPFTFLALALVSIAIALAAGDVHSRRLTVGSALISIAFGIAAGTLDPGSAMYSPSNTWALRDPAAAFAILSAASAAGLVLRPPGGTRFAAVASAVALLAAAALQGPAYAARLVFTDIPQSRDQPPWTQDMTAPGDRASIRGLPRDRVSPGERLALWPDVRLRMRNARRASTDFADAGYLLVTAWTKQRTMRSLVEPNEEMFHQATDLPSEVLCDSNAVRFLRLRYLLLPAGVECPPWRRVPGLLVDGWLEVGEARERDTMVRALPAGVSARIGAEPALTARSALLPALVPIPGTELIVGPRGTTVALADAAVANGHVLVLPLAYDPAWRASSGRLQNVGGLLALAGVEQRHVTMEFRPDGVAVLRAVSMTIAQILAVVGLLGLACLGSVVTYRKQGNPSAPNVPVG